VSASDGRNPERARLHELMAVGEAERAVADAWMADLKAAQDAARRRHIAAKGLVTRARKDGSAEKIAAAVGRERQAYTDFMAVSDASIDKMFVINRAALERLGELNQQIGITWGRRLCTTSTACRRIGSMTPAAECSKRKLKVMGQSARPVARRPQGCQGASARMSLSGGGKRGCVGTLLTHRSLRRAVPGSGALYGVTPLTCADCVRRGSVVPVFAVPKGLLIRRPGALHCA
jgi:hypothetical protein